MNYPFVVISGIIGAGKSTLTELLTLELEKKYPVQAYMEKTETNPYLVDYYQSMDDYRSIEPEYSEAGNYRRGFLKGKISRLAFEMQIHLLYERYRQHQLILWNIHQEAAIQDRSIFEDQLFVNILEKMEILDKRAANNYRNSLEIMSVHFRMPDLIIYLDVKPETGMHRKEIRGRDSEKAVFLEYQAALAEEYGKWAYEMERKTRVEFVDWNIDNREIGFILEEIIKLMP